MAKLHQSAVREEAPPFEGELMANLGLRGIHFGCGRLLKPGWLNTDSIALRDAQGREAVPGRITVYADGLHYLRHDATEPFPIEDASFEWAYSEHFIEHLTPGEAVPWLEQVRRLLRVGGHARITTPDLRKYVRGYGEPGDRFYAEHRGQISPLLEKALVADESRPGLAQLRRDFLVGETAVPDRAAFMLNQIFYLWEHRWIYDLDELRHVVSLAGFDPAAVVECGFREGRAPEVAALDSAHRRDETLYAEAERT